MNYQDHITIEPGKRGGKPCIRGMRITVYDVLDYLTSDMRKAEILADFAELTRDDIRACLAFAADRERKLFTLAYEKKGTMTDTLDAIFEKGAFRLLQPPTIPFKEGQHVRLVVKTPHSPDAILDLAAQVYAGLTPAEIDEIEAIALGRE